MHRPIADVGGNGTVSGLGDCLMIIRFALGYRDELLVQSTIAVDDIRRTHDVVGGYIESVWHLLDVDGNGETSLADAFLLFMYEAGFRGEDLIFMASNENELVEPSAKRTTAEEIEEYCAFLIAAS